MLLAMNRRLRRTQGFLAVAFAAALVIGPDLAEAQDAGRNAARPRRQRSRIPDACGSAIPDAAAPR